MCHGAKDNFSKVYLLKTNLTQASTVDQQNHLFHSLNAPPLIVKNQTLMYSDTRYSDSKQKKSNCQDFTEVKITLKNK